jgi:uncharacterized protein (TIGR02246 family)
MNHRTGFAVFAAGILLLAGCGEKARDVSAEIAAANQQVSAAVAAGDGMAVAALYTEDALLMPPNSAAIAGRAGIAAFWQGGIGAGIKGITLKTIEAQGHGDTAHEVGEYQLTAAENRPIDQGKYIVIWKKVDGQWLLYRDIWNTSRK